MKLRLSRFSTLGIFFAILIASFLLCSTSLASASAISGRATTYAGDGIGGVLVYAYTSTDMIYGLRAVAATDAQGDYSLTGLSSGSYKIQFNPYGLNYLPEWYNNKPSFQTANTITLVEGETLNGINAALATAGGISGKVTSQSGAGISGVTVYAYSAVDSVYGYKAMATTDSLGNYTLLGLASGDHKVQFNPYGLNYLSEWYNNKTSWQAANAIAVAEGETVSGINALLAMAGSISGKVTNLSGQGIPGVTVYAYGATDSVYGYKAMATTDSQGNYTLVGLASGDYKVEFKPYGLNYLSEWYNNRPSFQTAIILTIAAGETESGINALLATAGSISGRVTNQSGSGIGGVTVYAYGATDSIYGFRTMATTDSQGYYTVMGLQTGDYKIQFNPYGLNYLSEWYNNKMNFATANAITVAAGEEVPNISAILATGASLAGRVTNASGFGIPGVNVVVWDAATYAFRASTKTGSDGTYRAVGLASGNYKVQFDAQGTGYLSKWYNNQPNFSSATVVYLSEGTETTAVNAVLSPGGTDVTSPYPVVDFSASDGEAGQSTLTWSNPLDPDLAQVVVIRKIGSFPTSLFDGVTIFDNSSPVRGGANMYIDAGLVGGVRYFYAVFAKDTVGNWNISVDSILPERNADEGIPLLIQANVSLLPAYVSAEIGQEFILDVKIDSVTDLYGYEFEVSFDPAIVRVKTDGLGGSLATEGLFLPSGGSTYFLPGTADNVTGKLTGVASALLAAGNGVSGEGVLVRIPFVVVGVGKTDLKLTQVRLSDSQERQIGAATVDSLFDNQDPTASISSPPNGATVSGQTFTVTGTASDYGGSGVSRVEISTTGGNTWEIASGTGNWSYVWSLPANALSCSIKVRAVDKAGNVQPTPASITVLVDNFAGDPNFSGQVDIFDLVIVAKAFGSKPGDANWQSRADLNSDGVVNVFDLVIVAKNFGKKSL